MNIYACFESRWISAESETTSVNKLAFVVLSCLPSRRQNAINQGNAVK